VGVFDQNEQLIIIDSDSECILATDDLTLEISGNTKVKSEMGVYTFNYISLIANPDYLTKLKFTSSAISSKETATLNETISASIELPVAFR
jgi:hypothetical protein